MRESMTFRIYRRLYRVPCGKFMVRRVEETNELPCDILGLGQRVHCKEPNLLAVPESRD